MIVSHQRTHRRAMPRNRVAPPAGKVGDIIPFDYGATFDISGRPGNVLQDVINISPESVFVAVAVGYGFEEERGRPLSFLPAPQSGGNLPADSVLPGDITLGELPSDVLLEGFRVNPRFEAHIFRFNGVELSGSPAAVRGERRFSDQPIPAGIIRDQGFFQRVKSPADISFLFSIVDGGSGRELQDEPTHNLASLGKSNGERPFRLLAQPITFLPRSAIRLQVIERSEGVAGKLFIVFYGYKRLGSSGCPEPVARTLAGPAICPTETIGSPSARVIPFDYVTTVTLAGRAGASAEGETTVNVEGGFVATSIGYGLLIEESGISIEWGRLGEVKTLRGSLIGLTTVPPPSINLGDLPLRLFPASALTDGFRIRPELVRIAFDNNGQLANNLPTTWLDRLFERLNRVEDVSFRYSIFDAGRGRELQNQPLNNIAGLGIANGDRPFKRLARSIVFLPRSTIRIQVEEVFGRGTLFIVFQGYKFLSAPPQSGVSR
jgi:hypothetical protein